MEEAVQTDSLGTKPLFRVLRASANDSAGLDDASGRPLSAGISCGAGEGRGFLDLCFNPELAAEVTLQPVRRFGFDAAILFSDILVMPHALGRKVEFLAGEGPRLEPMADAAALCRHARERRRQDVGAGLRDGAAGEGGARCQDDVDRILRRAVDGRDLHDGGRGDARSGAGAAVCLSRSGDFRAADRSAGARLDRISGRPAQGRRRSGADFRYLGRRAAAGRVRALVHRADADESSTACANRCRAPRSSVFRAAPAAMALPYVRDAASMPSGSTGCSTEHLRATCCSRACAVQGNLDPLALLAGGAALDRAVDDVLDRLSATAR